MLTYKTLRQIKIITWVLVFAFLCGDMTHALAMNTPTAPKAPQSWSLQDIIQDPTRLHIPQEHVTLKEFHKGNNGKVIIHVQDAHSNYSGQMHMAQALDLIMQEHDIGLVLSEGGARNSTLTSIRKSLPQKEWKILARKFLREGIIQGEEYLNLTSTHDMRIEGIEYKDLYDEQVLSYAELATLRKEALTLLHAYQSSIQRLKNRTYSKPLLAFENTMQKLKDHPIQKIQELALNLPPEINLNVYPQIRKALSLKQLEKQLDFKTLRSDTPTYQNYLKQVSDLEFHELIEEINALENLIYKSLLHNSDNRMLHAIDQYITLLQKAYNIQLSSKDFQVLEDSRPDFPDAPWQAFINKQLERFNYYDDLVPYDTFLINAQDNLEDFYAKVSARDNAFLQNTHSVMKTHNASSAFLISGGYHTDNVLSLLRAQGYSYIVLTPKIDHETNHVQYEKLLLTGINEFEERSKKSNANHHVRPGMTSMAFLKKAGLAIKKNGGSRLALDNIALRPYRYQTPAKGQMNHKTSSHASRMAEGFIKSGRLKFAMSHGVSREIGEDILVLMKSSVPIEIKKPNKILAYLDGPGGVQPWIDAWTQKARRTQNKKERARYLYLAMTLLQSRSEEYKQRRAEFNEIYYDLYPEIERVGLSRKKNNPANLHFPYHKKPKKGYPIVMIDHGLMGSKEAYYLDDLTKAFLEKGYAVMRRDLPGQGENRHALNNKRAYYEFNRMTAKFIHKDRRFNNKRVFSIGYSAGGLLALRNFGNERFVTMKSIIAINSPIRDVFLNEGFHAENNWIWRHYGNMMNVDESKDSYEYLQRNIYTPDEITKLKKSKTPVLLVASEFDELLNADNHYFWNSIKHFATRLFLQGRNATHMPINEAIPEHVEGIVNFVLDADEPDFQAETSLSRMALHASPNMTTESDGQAYTAIEDAIVAIKAVKKIVGSRRSITEYRNPMGYTSDKRWLEKEGAEDAPDSESESPRMAKNIWPNMRPNLISDILQNPYGEQALTVLTDNMSLPGIARLVGAVDEGGAKITHLVGALLTIADLQQSYKRIDILGVYINPTSKWNNIYLLAENNKELWAIGVSYVFAEEGKPLYPSKRAVLKQKKRIFRRMAQSLIDEGYKISNVVYYEVLEREDLKQQLNQKSQRTLYKVLNAKDVAKRISARNTADIITHATEVLKNIPEDFYAKQRWSDTIPKKFFRPNDKRKSFDIHGFDAQKAIKVRGDLSESDPGRLEGNSSDASRMTEKHEMSGESPVAKTKADDVSQDAEAGPRIRLTIFDPDNEDVLFDRIATDLDEVDSQLAAIEHIEENIERILSEIRGMPAPAASLRPADGELGYLVAGPRLAEAAHQLEEQGARLTFLARSKKPVAIYVNEEKEASRMAEKVPGPSEADPEQLTKEFPQARPQKGSLLTQTTGDNSSGTVPAQIEGNSSHASHMASDQEKATAKIVHAFESLRDNWPVYSQVLERQGFLTTEEISQYPHLFDHVISTKPLDFIPSTTLAVDIETRRIRVNSTHVNGMTSLELQAQLAHEATHIVAWQRAESLETLKMARNLPPQVTQDHLNQVSFRNLAFSMILKFVKAEAEAETVENAIRRVIIPRDLKGYYETLLKSEKDKVLKMLYEFSHNIVRDDNDVDYNQLIHELLRFSDVTISMPMRSVFAGAFVFQFPQYLDLLTGGKEKNKLLLKIAAEWFSERYFEKDLRITNVLGKLSYLSSDDTSDEVIAIRSKLVDMDQPKVAVKQTETKLFGVNATNQLVAQLKNKQLNGIAKVKQLALHKAVKRHKHEISQANIAPDERELVNALKVIIKQGNLDNDNYLAIARAMKSIAEASHMARSKGNDDFQVVDAAPNSDLTLFDPDKDEVLIGHIDADLHETEAQLATIEHMEDNMENMLSEIRAMSIRSASLRPADGELGYLVAGPRLAEAAHQLEEQGARLTFLARSKKPVAIYVNDEDVVVLQADSKDTFTIFGEDSETSHTFEMTWSREEDMEILKIDEKVDASQMQSDLQYHAAGIVNFIASHPQETFFVAIDSAPQGSGIAQVMMRAIQKRLSIMSNVQVMRGTGKALRSRIDSAIARDEFTHIVAMAHEATSRAHLRGLQDKAIIASVAMKDNGQPSESQFINALGITHLSLDMTRRQFDQHFKTLFYRITGHSLNLKSQFLALLKGEYTLYPKLHAVSARMAAIIRSATESFTSA